MRREQERIQSRFGASWRIPVRSGRKSDSLILRPQELATPAPPGVVIAAGARSPSRSRQPARLPAIEISPAAHRILQLPASLLQALLLLAAGAAFLWILRRRLQLLRAASPQPRLDRPGRRLLRLLVIGFGQARQPRYRLAGGLHILIFAGFLILSVRSLGLIGEAFAPGFADFGPAYAASKDWVELLVLAACATAACRRLLLRPARYHDRHATESHAREALLILGLISTLMVADAVYDGSGLGLRGETGGWREPLATLAAGLLGGSETTLLRAHLAGFWVHNATLLLFLCLLPLGKHFHVLTALPNVFFSKLEPSGAVKPPSYREADFDSLESVGVGRLEDFGWKHLLDAYTCTDCGRCSDHCPAYAAGTPLSPRMISLKMRAAAYAHYPVFGPVVPPAERPALVGETIGEGELWSCTTCGACEEACPVTIEYIDKVVDMRRRLVDEGRLPATLQKPMAALEKRGNPFGKTARQRGRWAEPDGEEEPLLPALDPGEAADVLFFTDSAVAFDPRLQRTAAAFARLLRAAGVEAGHLGRDEVDSGHEARRFGEEGLFLALREQNRAALAERRFARVVTTDPHAMNALRHDYGLERPVLHHSQLLAELAADGRLSFSPLADRRTYAFHDPCYLGRHNGQYEAPRRLLAAIPGLRTVEMERCRNRSFCCGGGSLYLFNEVECERRMGEIRLEQAVAAGAQVVVTACPFCLINLEDAVKTSGREGEIEILDLAELAARAAGLATPAAASGG
ncbi:MAG: 4Fe-4S dicluster domain-containing protein [Planctomycetota bacterium]|nr:MAG: 4Fe-4S dicluster domain-containing protein [Planctomycetota bacterium]